MGYDHAMPDATSTTRAEFVHAQLRSQILRGRYTPGARLRLVELAERFSVSQSVIREALTRLAGQKLVVALPQQGFRVMTLSAAGLRELTDARVQVESLVIGLAVPRGDLAWESSVVAAHHQLARTSSDVEPDGTLSERWFRAHEEFHRVLLDGCGNAWLSDLAATLRAAAALHLRWSGSVAGDYDRDIAAEHRGLLDAVLARDAESAAAKLGEHIGRTTAALLDVTTTPEPSDADAS